MGPAAPLITLTSDFGQKDSYVAQMKGVLLSQGPANLRLVDLSHGLPRGDRLSAALFLEAVVPRFATIAAPAVHLAVVDPGVGSERRLLVVEHPGRPWIVAPDNGIVTRVLCPGDGSTCWAARATEVTRSAGAPSSATFHGRDLFAPIAARLARGDSPADFCDVLDDPVRLTLPVAESTESGARGEVLQVDRFGNLITNLGDSDLPPLPAGHRRYAQVAGEQVGPLRSHYAQVAVGELLLLWDSGGRLEIAQREGNAAKRLGAGRGTPVTITSKAADRLP